jgi:hypothetical protein
VRIYMGVTYRFMNNHSLKLTARRCCQRIVWQGAAVTEDIEIECNAFEAEHIIPPPVSVAGQVFKFSAVYSYLLAGISIFN